MSKLSAGDLAVVVDSLNSSTSIADDSGVFGYTRETRNAVASKFMRMLETIPASLIESEDTSSALVVDKSNLVLKFKKLRRDAIVPEYARPGDSGLDLFACIDKSIALQPGERALVDTGIAIELPAGYEGQVRSKSGLAINHGLAVLTGTIDNPYRGNICVVLLNTSQATYTVQYGQKIAQLVVAPVAQVKLEEVEELSATIRNADGFGSTGV